MSLLGDFSPEDLVPAAHGHRRDHLPHRRHRRSHPEPCSCAFASSPDQNHVSACSVRGLAHRIGLPYAASHVTAASIRSSRGCPPSASMYAICAAEDVQCRRSSSGWRSASHSRAEVDAKLHAAIDLIEPLGADTLLHGRFGAARELVTVRQGGHVIARPGEMRHFKAEPGHLHLFDSQTGKRFADA